MSANGGVSRSLIHSAGRRRIGHTRRDAAAPGGTPPQATPTGRERAIAARRGAALAVAGWGRRFRIAIQGRDPRNGRPFIWHVFQARPGGGASAAGDGWPGGGEWQAAGGIKFGSLEVTEVRFPLFFKTHEFRPGSGGAGQYRGGPGGIVEMVVETAEPAVGNTAGDGIRHGACGILGGEDGLPHRYRLHSGNAEPRTIKTKEVGLPIRPGDRLGL